MPSINDWDPFQTHIQGGLNEGNFMSGQFVLLCSGPPFYNQIDLQSSGLASPTMVYPIGLAQNISVSQNKAVSRIFEIGSNRSYFITGRTVGQLSLGRIVYHGASLLRILYAYYDTAKEQDNAATAIRPLLNNSTTPGVKPFQSASRGGVKAGDGTTGEAGEKAGLKSIYVPPGYDNMFLNLASDLFSQPMGLLLILKDNAKNTIASMYFEQCQIPQHMIAVDSQGLIMQESVAVQYERMIPIKGTQLNVVDGIIEDTTGGYTTGTPA